MSPSSLTLAQFNTAPAADLEDLLRACAPIDRWTGAILAGRPYADVEQLRGTASALAGEWTAAEVHGALAHHPRIGERAQGLAAVEAAHSRAEQAGVEDPGAWVAANARYEERFGTVFLVRAAGRSQAEMLAELERRLALDEEQERSERAEQLRQIALLRLEALVPA